LQRELDSKQLPAQLVEQALGESLLFHLRQCYQSYLLEVAESYNLFPAKLENAISFKALLDEQGRNCAQVNELIALETSNSWLSAMLQAPTSAILPTHARPAHDTIAAVQIENADPEGPNNGLLARGKLYLAALEALIDNQRGQLEEW
jgi:hypothetical protein